MWYVYIVECSDKTLYTGISKNPEVRVRTHNTDKKNAAKYVWPRRPVILRFKKRCPSKPDALQKEYQIKQLSRLEKLKLIAYGPK